MCRHTERFVDLKLTIEVGFRYSIRERYLETIMRDSKSEKSSRSVEEGTYEVDRNSLDHLEKANRHRHSLSKEESFAFPVLFHCQGHRRSFLFCYKLAAKLINLSSDRNHLTGLVWYHLWPFSVRDLCHRQWQWAISEELEGSVFRRRWSHQGDCLTGNDVEQLTVKNWKTILTEYTQIMFSRTKREGRTF